MHPCRRLTLKAIQIVADVFCQRRGSDIGAQVAGFKKVSREPGLCQPLSFRKKGYSDQNAYCDQYRSLKKAEYCADQSIQAAEAQLVQRLREKHADNGRNRRDDQRNHKKGDRISHLAVVHDRFDERGNGFVIPRCHNEAQKNPAQRED